MAYQKLQVSEALPVIPGSVRIPDPTSVVCLDTATGATVGTGSFTGGTTLITTGTKFTEAGIYEGAIIYNTTASKAYYVVSVDSDTQLTISTGTAGGGSDQYSIFTKATGGCILFVGGAGDVTLQMAEKNGNTTAATQSLNHEVTFKSISAGCFMPTQVVRVSKVTTATDIIALW